MNLTHGEFIEGVDYRKTTPRERKLAAWKYVLLRDFVIYSDEPLTKDGKSYSLNTMKGQVLGEIHPFRIVWCKGYAWDGCTKAPDWLAWLASGIHDLFFQFSGVKNFPFSRWVCDSIFYALAQTPVKLLYRLGLFLFSWRYFGKNSEGLWIAVTNGLPEE